MSTWATLLKKTWNENKNKAGYKYKNAMQDAKKVYRKTHKVVNTTGKKVRKTKKVKKAKKTKKVKKTKRVKGTKKK
jgi:hypothetical protein